MIRGEGNSEDSTVPVATGTRRRTLSDKQVEGRATELPGHQRGRHDFVMRSAVAGPNVVVSDHDLHVRKRGSAGTGHGRAGAYMVLWNYTARRVVCQNPPPAVDWAIGCRALRRGGDDCWESSRQRV